MFNKVIMAGNLTRDVELRYLPNGSAVANTAIATNRKFKKQDGTPGEEVCFTDITFFGRSAEIANQYLKRGSKVLVDGRLKLDQWTDQNGGKRSKHSIIVETMQMLGSRDDNQSVGSSYDQPQSGGSYESAPLLCYYDHQKPQAQQNKAAGNEMPEIDINEDEIPF